MEQSLSNSTGKLHILFYECIASQEGHRILHRILLQRVSCQHVSVPLALDRSTFLFDNLNLETGLKFLCLKINLLN